MFSMAGTDGERGRVVVGFEAIYDTDDDQYVYSFEYSLPLYLQWQIANQGFPSIDLRSQSVKTCHTILTNHTTEGK